MDFMVKHFKIFFKSTPQIQSFATIYILVSTPLINTTLRWTKLPPTAQLYYWHLTSGKTILLTIKRPPRGN